MTFRTFTAGLLFWIICSESHAEKLFFHVSTVRGEHMKGVEIRVSNSGQKRIKPTDGDGLVSFDSNTDEFDDIEVLVRKKGWSVVSPELGGLLNVSYLKKKGTIEIKMQQTDEIKVSMPPIEIVPTPTTYQTEPQNLVVSQSNGSLPKPNQFHRIQIKACNTPLSDDILKCYEGILTGHTVMLFYDETAVYSYKYTLQLSFQSKTDAQDLLQKVRAAGFPDAFLVTYLMKEQRI